MPGKAAQQGAVERSLQCIECGAVTDAWSITKELKPCVSGPCAIGGSEGTRTRDLLRDRQAF